MSGQVVYAVFAEHEVHWHCVCLFYFVEDAWLADDALQVKGKSTAVRIVNRDEALDLLLKAERKGSQGCLWRDIPGGCLVKEEA